MFSNWPILAGSTFLGLYDRVMRRRSSSSAKENWTTLLVYFRYVLRFLFVSLLITLVVVPQLQSHLQTRKALAHMERQTQDRHMELLIHMESTRQESLDALKVTSISPLSSPEVSPVHFSTWKTHAICYVR